MDQLGSKKKLIFRYMEEPDKYNDHLYELYGPYGEIDSHNTVRKYSFDASRLRSVKLG
jgi:hypothetical protein